MSTLVIHIIPFIYAMYRNLAKLIKLKTFNGTQLFAELDFLTVQIGGVQLYIYPPLLGEGI
jgi:hypothetical protein